MFRAYASFHPCGLWLEWLDDNLRRLSRRARLQAPSWLPHPAEAGFAESSIAEPHGQARDWVLSLSDGSRVHVHEHEDGRLVVHRDRYDPSAGPLRAVAHFLIETRAGKATLAVGAVALSVKAVKALKNALRE